jgi:glyoxylase-like metal-dependent hydrolase (beta-lactamase superfamily II)
MNLYPINTGYFNLDGGAMFGVVPKLIWNKIYPADSNNHIRLALRCLLIEDGNRFILVDDGIGDKQDAKFFSHYHLEGDDTLNSSLARFGFHRDDITDVLLTHLHFDHCGGSIIRKGEQLIPAFKNATYWSNERHWKWATEPNDREKASFLKENILPIRESGQLKMIELPLNLSQTLVNFSEEIKVRFACGHTDAMMLPQISYKGRTVVFMADLLPTAAHLPVPYIMGYDMFPLTSMEEKKSFLQKAVSNDYVLFFEHDASIECCNLEMTEKGVRVKDRFLLSDL